MLKFRKDKEEAEVSPQGVASQGNAFRGFWLTTVLGVTIPLLLCFAYLLLLRESSVQSAQYMQLSQSLAQQQAANVEQLFQGFRERLRQAAASPLVLAAMETDDANDLAMVEKAVMDFFPGIASLRVITLQQLGRASTQGINLGLRNNIEIVLVQRASDGQTTDPESYQFEQRWLTSLAERMVHPRDPSRQAVLLATFDNQVINDALAGLASDQGRSTLHQVYRGTGMDRSSEIAAVGNGDENYETSVSLNGNTWNLTFSPSPSLLANAAISPIPLLAVAAVLFVTALASLALLLVRYEKFLAAEVEKISGAADKKTPLEVDQPQLLPLAKQLRRATLRNTMKVGAGKKRAPAPAPAAQGSDRPIADPMFQDTDMIDKDDDEALDLSTAAEPKPAPATEAPAEPPAEASSGGFPAHVFRAYDIRGVVPDELNEEFAARIGGALGTLAGEVEQQAVVVGCDGRETSPALRNALVKALLSTGRDVVDLGVVPTPLVYYATQTLSTQTGVMVTGSHNSREFNGFKITLKGKPFAGADLLDFRKRVAAGKFSEGAGRLAKQDLVPTYLDAVVGDMAIAVPLRVVVDAGNGVTGRIAPRMLEELSCEVIPLYCEIDGSFPNHHPDPSVDDNLKDLQSKVLEVGADFGVAFDGDGDRIAVVTGEGQIVRTDKLLMLFAQDVVSRNPGADVVCDVKCSRHLTQLVSRYGGRPVLWKTGHAFMREKVIETGALLGGEFSGHIFFGERWYGFDDGMYAAARLAEIVSGAGTDLTTLLSDFPDTENTPEIRIPVPDKKKFELMSRIAEGTDFSPGKVNDLDGIRVDYRDGWGLIRASNTTPALVARFEAHDADALARIMDQFREQISQVEPELNLGF